MRTKSQQSNKNETQAMKEAKMAKQKVEKQKKFALNLQSVRNEFEARCEEHMSSTVENCD